MVFCRLGLQELLIRTRKEIRQHREWLLLIRKEYDVRHRKRKKQKSDKKSEKDTRETTIITKHRHYNETQVRTQHVSCARFAAHANSSLSLPTSDEIGRLYI